ncbi:MAG: hypothetical protein A2681_01470 [Candidatus Liptonbacteria bacterium RIFCSPHIGHO2_01_FULL_56_18b]|nr:MAG: hypothetical protein A2681_01470 [Candidatus Liptonbacteria bacterium RIFCSPHIGHO2_01_FULL_56_18b]
MRLMMSVILAVFLAFLGVQIVSFYREEGRVARVSEQATAELERAVQDRDTLEADFRYFLDPVNLEKELRARFNYRAPGEKLIIIVSPQSSTTSSSRP